MVIHKPDNVVPASVVHKRQRDRACYQHTHADRVNQAAAREHREAKQAAAREHREAKQAVSRERREKQAAAHEHREAKQAVSRERHENRQQLVSVERQSRQYLVNGMRRLQHNDWQQLKYGARRL